MLTAMMATTICLWDHWGFGRFFQTPDALVKDLNKTGYFIAGALVGLGTKMGNGCTSGHGVCGLPRLAPRSWVFVPVFLVVAILTATYRSRHPFLVDDTNLKTYTPEQYHALLNFFCLGSIGVVIGIFLIYLLFFKTGSKITELVCSLITASAFAAGLVISGMNQRSKILGFLTINENWDPSLLIVLCGAVGLNFITMNFIDKFMPRTFIGTRPRPLLSKLIDARLLVGAVLFGLGWGLGGLCPGPGFLLFPFMTPHISVAWFGGLTVGQWVVLGYDSLAIKSKVKRN